MNTNTSRLPTKQAPSKAEVEHFITQAHQMRAEYIVKSLKSGLASLRGLFSHKPGNPTIDDKFLSTKS